MSAVTENALPVFLALGYRVDYELLKEGVTFCCVRQGVPLDVSVLTISKVSRLLALTLGTIPASFLRMGVSLFPDVWL